MRFERVLDWMCDLFSTGDSRGDLLFHRRYERSELKLFSIKTGKLGFVRWVSKMIRVHDEAWMFHRMNELSVSLIFQQICANHTNYRRTEANDDEADDVVVCVNPFLNFGVHANRDMRWNKSQKNYFKHRPSRTDAFIIQSQHDKALNMTFKMKIPELKRNSIASKSSDANLQFQFS